MCVYLVTEIYIKTKERHPSYKITHCQPTHCQPTQVIDKVINQNKFKYIKSSFSFSFESNFI